MFVKDELTTKQYFKLGEVCSLTGVKPYVLRFWVNEFECIDPIDADNGEKYFSLEDVDAIKEIKRLLFDEKMSIEEAKAYFYKKDNIIEAKEDESEDVIEVEPPQLPIEGSEVEDFDLDKLSLAKSKLQELIEKTNSWV